MTLHELVVVLPFANYKRGDVIKDPEIVAKILDVNDDMHSNAGNNRKTSRLIELKNEIQQEEILLSSVAENKKPEINKPSASKLEKK